MCPSRVIFLTGCFTFVLMLPARLLCFPTLEDRLALVGKISLSSFGNLQIVIGIKLILLFIYKPLPSFIRSGLEKVNITSDPN